jgi:hypothetical protein
MMKIIIKNLKAECILLMIIIALVGCTPGTNEKQQRSKETENKTQSDIQQEKTNAEKVREVTREYAEKLWEDEENLKGRPFSEIEPQQKPYVQTFFVKTQGTSPLEESSALYVYTDAKDMIIDIRIDEFSGMPSHSYTESDYVVDKYDRKSGTVLGETKKEDIERYEGKDIEAFEKDHNLGRPSIMATDLRNHRELYYYPLFTEEGEEPSVGIFVLIKEWQIVGIKIDEPNFSFDRLDEYFSKK